MVKEKCFYCGKVLNKPIGEINRAKKLGSKLFCNKKCLGLSYRTYKDDAEKRSIKAWYDGFIKYSRTEKELEADKKKRADYFKKDYAANPDKYKEIRRKKQSKHNEYCRQPKYKEYKKEYDEKYRATKNYGEYGEAFILLKQIQAEVDNRQAQFDKGNFNKKQKRERLWKSSQRLT